MPSTPPTRSSLSLEAMTGMVADMSVNADAMRGRRRGLRHRHRSRRLAGARRWLPFRQAHHVTGRIVARPPRRRRPAPAAARGHAGDRAAHHRGRVRRARRRALGEPGERGRHRAETRARRRPGTWLRKLGKEKSRLRHDSGKGKGRAARKEAFREPILNGPRLRLALIGALAGALRLAGCGRKGPSIRRPAPRSPAEADHRSAASRSRAPRTPACAAGARSPHSSSTSAQLSASAHSMHHFAYSDGVLHAEDGRSTRSPQRSARRSTAIRRRRWRAITASSPTPSPIPTRSSASP